MYNKNFPPAKEAALELEAAIDALFELQGQPVIYRSTLELLKLDPTPPFCSFCGKGSNQVAQIIPGNDANICDQCVALFPYAFSLEELGQAVINRSTSELLKFDQEHSLCSFCGKKYNQVTLMIPGNDANICDQCVRKNREIK